MIVRKCGKMLEEWGNFRENSVENQGNLAKKNCGEFWEIYKEMWKISVGNRKNLTKNYGELEDFFNKRNSYSLKLLVCEVET